MAEASEALDKTPNRTEGTVVTDNPAGYIYDKILGTYPFLTDEERRDYVAKTSCLTDDLGPLGKIQAYLNLLDNPHAVIKELQPKNTRKYPTPIRRPEGQDQEHPYGVMVNDVLYIRIPSWRSVFTETSAILDELIETHKATVRGYVIDLRNNKGGSDQPARRFAQHFLPSGEIVFGRQVTMVGGKPVEKPIVFNSHNESPITSPIVLLVSDNTLSSSERIVALMRQRDNVVIIGSETRGGSAGAKDYYVEIDGKKYTVPIPTWRFFLPGQDRPLEETKIQPDIYQDPTKPEIVEFAISHIRAMARGGNVAEN